MTKGSGARIFTTWEFGVPSAFVILASSFSINPLVRRRNEHRQFFHHVLRLSDGADHTDACGGVPFFRHFSPGMAAPALGVGAAGENVTVDLRQLAIMQPRLAGALDVIAVIEHETRPVRVSEIFKANDLHLISRLAVV